MKIQSNYGIKDSLLLMDNYNWYALYVKSRHEFVTQSELTRKGINTFLPSVKKISQWKDRKKIIESPLFPGYIFFYIQPEKGFINVLKTKGAVNIISSEPGHPSAVPSEEINSLMLLIKSGQELDIYPHLKEGTGVRIKKGPLSGAEGTLNRKFDQYMFLVNIELLGRSVGIKIYADDVEAI